MKTKSKLSALLFLILKPSLICFSIILLSDILNAQETGLPYPKGERPKSIVVLGKTTTKYIYNKFGKIDEEQSLSGWTKFHYDAKGRLVKKESAMDPSWLSSASGPPLQYKQLMTALNSTVTTYDLFEYNDEGRVATIRHYAKLNGEGFEYRSMTIPTYEGQNIIKSCSYDTTGLLAGYNIYEYDNKGNVTTESSYSCYSKYKVPILTMKTSYKCDDKKNPYKKIYGDQAWAPYGTNPNNIIETTINDDKIPFSRSSYKYNDRGFPIEELSGRSKFELQYE